MSKDARAHEIRDQVAAEYAKRLAGTGCGAPSVRADGHAYSAEDLAGNEAVYESSFGCGNPLAVSGVRPGDTIVDLGSGAGLDVILAARKTGPGGRAIGIDMTDAMIERARANIARAGLANAEIRKGIIENLPVESSSVDWVISNCVVNLSPEKERVFAEISRVLKPGGRMLISDIVVNDAPAWARRLAGVFNASVAGAIGEREYRSGLERAGLREVEIRDRYVYDRVTIEELAKSDVTESRLPGFVVRAVVSRVARAVDGKVVSIKVYARKSGG